MNKKNPIGQAITHMLGAHTAPPPKSSSNIGNHLIFHHDVTQALVKVAQQARLQYDRATGGQILQCQFEQTALEANLAESTQHLTHARTQLRNIPEFIRSSADASGGIPFRQWLLKDRILIGIGSVIGIAMVATGCSNVFSNLMAAGIPIFLKHPALAWSLSAVVPAGTFLLHAGANFLEHERSQRLYARAIFGASCVLLLLWSGAFAMNFTGVTGSLNLDALIEGGSNSSSLFVWVQLASEIMIAAALGLVIDEICARYRPNSYRSSPEHQQLSWALKRDEAARDLLQRELIGVIKKRCELESAREAVCNEATAEFLSKKTRFDAFHADIQN